MGLIRRALAWLFVRSPAPEPSAPSPLAAAAGARCMLRCLDARAEEIALRMDREETPEAARGARRALFLMGFRLRQSARAVALLALVPFLLAGGRPVREVLIHGRPFPNRVAILVDRSGSMYGPKHGLAVHEAMRVAEQAGDDGRVRFYVFDDQVLAEPQGWIKLPDAEALAIARGFLRHNGPTGNTNLVGAMREVLALEEPDLGVVIVTDEEPDGGALPAAAEIARLNAARAEPATIGVIGIFPPSAELGAAVARSSGGPYLRIVMPEPEAAEAPR